MKTCNIKLCGMSREVDLDVVAEAQPDMVGFIVNFPRSHRSIAPERLVELVCYLHQQDMAGTIKTVGVFVDQPPKSVANIAREASLDAVQLHGCEDAPYLECLHKLLPNTTRIIQAFRVHTAKDVAAAEASLADMVLLDSGQGSGKAFDWSLIQLVQRPFMLAGGLTPQNIAQAIQTLHPWGVDMSSGIETDRLKDPEKIREAVAAVKQLRQ